MSQFANVTVLSKSNVYFDGKCVSHTILMPDGSKKTIGVILPSALKFNTDVPETMDITAGVCRVRLAGSQDWITYRAGGSFSVPGKSSFDIEALENVDYVCHYG